ncbi:MAG: site-2 protease family protein [Planctomycetota bacterium]
MASGTAAAGQPVDLGRPARTPGRDRGPHPRDLPAVRGRFGHCLACRLVGGHADEALLWPLGGLAATDPPRRWTAHLITALGGPVVNVLICLTAGTMLGLRTGQWLHVALPNPLSFDDALYAADLGSGRWDTPLVCLLVVNWTSSVVLLLNLLPVLPLDGGRILRAVLWSRLGEERSLRVTVGLGYLAATALGLAGAVLGNWIILGVAVLGGLVCHRVQRRLEPAEDPVLDPSPVTDVVPARPVAVGTAGTPMDRTLAAEPPDDEEQLDEILAVIATSGLQSLTADQREVLERATARRQAAAGDDGAAGDGGRPGR